MKAVDGLLRDPYTVVDGGLSTALELAGHSLDDPLWTARFLADQPEVLTDAHLAYLRAGADVVITSSYQASVAGFVAAGHDASTARNLIASSTAVARRAVERFVDERPASPSPLVAASVGPFGATLHDGSEYHGNYEASWVDVRAFHRERLAILVDSKPDLLAIETIPSLAEAEIVLDELSVHPEITAWLTFSCRDASTTCHGELVADAAAVIGSHPQLAALGVNCTAPEFVSCLLRAIAKVIPGEPLIVYPNHGREWDAATGCWVGPDGGIDIDRNLDEWLSAGARLIGGCCGIGPAGITDLAAARTR